MFFLGISSDLKRFSHGSKFAYGLYMQKDTALFNDKMMIMVDGVNTADAQVLLCGLLSSKEYK